MSTFDMYKTDGWKDHPHVFAGSRLLRELSCYDQILANKFDELSSHEKSKVESWIDNNINDIDITEKQKKLAISGLHNKLVNRALLEVIRRAMNILGYHKSIC